MGELRGSESRNGLMGTKRVLVQVHVALVRRNSETQRKVAILGQPTAAA